MTETRSNWLLRAGAGLLCLSVVLAFAPDLVAPAFDPQELERQLSEGSTSRLVGSGLLVLAIGCGWYVRRGRSAGSTATPEAASERAGVRSDVDRDPFATDAGADDAGDEVLTGWGLTRADETTGDRLRARLRSVAVDALAATGDHEPAAARRRVDSGEWTDDRIAASFLGDESAPDPTLRWRLVHWFRPERATASAIDRTIAAIRAYQDGERP